MGNEEASPSGFGPWPIFPVVNHIYKFQIKKKRTFQSFPILSNPFFCLFRATKNLQVRQPIHTVLNLNCSLPIRTYPPSSLLQFPSEIYLFNS